MVFEQQADIGSSGLARMIRKGALVLLAGTSLLTLSACGAFIHDERLVGPATAAEESMTSAATLAPFDDQLTKLAALATEEDLVVAQYWTNGRDSEMAQIIAARPSTTTLSNLIERRLRQLEPEAVPAVGLEPLYGRLRDAETQADSMRRDYERIRAEGDERDLGCKALREAFSKQQAQTPEPGEDEPTSLARRVAAACYDALAVQTEIDAFATNFRGEIPVAVKAYLDAAASASRPDLSPYAAELKKQIKVAEDYAKNGAEADLIKFHTRIGEILQSASDAAKLAGWQEVDTAVDKLLRAQICTAEADGVDAATLEAADCAGVGPRTTAGRARAAWGLASAIAQLIQANAANSRSAQWLLAAKAIVAGEVADAKLQAAQAKLLAGAYRRHFDALVIEARALKSAQAALSGNDPSCSGLDIDCSTAGYTQAWNTGRIPAEVIENAPIQIDREYAVHRARAAAEKQRSLALAGIGALKAKAAAGIKPDEIAQALLDAGLIAATWRN